MQEGVLGQNEFDWKSTTDIRKFYNLLINNELINSTLKQ